MKKNILYLASMAVVVMAIITACIKEDDDTLVLKIPIAIVDIDDPYEVQKSIVVTDGSMIKGDLPETTSGNYNLSSSIPTIMVNNGGMLILPLIYNSLNEVQKIFLQVVGADGSYYTVKPTIVTSVDGYCYISIQIPEGMTNGTFTFQYKVEDNQGDISNLVSTVVTVTDIIASCANSSASGSSGLTFTTLFLGNTAGPVSIYYDTYSLPDRIDIYQGNEWLTGTGNDPDSPIPPLCDCGARPLLDGFVGQSGKLSFNYNPSKGKNITVVVSGCLNNGTAWDWYLEEAPECNKYVDDYDYE